MVIPDHGSLVHAVVDFCSRLPLSSGLMNGSQFLAHSVFQFQSGKHQVAYLTQSRTEAGLVGMSSSWNQ